MDLQALSLSQFQSFLLILTRVAVLFTAAPILGNARVPTPIKIGLSLFISILLLFSLNSRGLLKNQPPVSNIFQLGGAAMAEVLIGLAVAYTAYLFFTGIQMAGQIVDIQVGFGLVNVLDPGSNSQVSVLGQFYFLMAMLFYLGIDGHHYLLRAMGDSFELIPPGSLAWLERSAAIGPVLAQSLTKLMLIALQVAGPAVAALFLTNLSMGLLSRTLPQMNVFIVGLPLNVLIGVAVTVLSMRLLGTLLRSVVETMGQNIAVLLHALAR